MSSDISKHRFYYFHPSGIDSPTFWRVNLLNHLRRQTGMKKIISINYPQGSLIVEGKKGEVSLIAQDVSRSIGVIIRDWAVVDMLGAMKLSFLGFLSQNHTIKGEGGYIVVAQTDKKGELQTSIRIGRKGEEERLSFFLSLIENHRVQYILVMCLER